MYSINGIPLDNAAKGWALLAPSKPIPELARRTSTLTVPGRDGVVPLPIERAPVPMVFVVETPRANLEALLALFDAAELRASYTATPTRHGELSLLTANYEGYGPADATVEVTFTTRLDSAALRDIAETTSTAVTLSSSSVEIAVFPGLSASVFDAIVRVQGPVSGLRVTDDGGSWWEYLPAVPAGTSIAFVDGFATLSTASASNWDDYDSDVSGAADFNGPRGSFEITPSFTDPSTRAGELTVTTATRGAGASIRVRGRGAYLV